jgi:hypothetical protein
MRRAVPVVLAILPVAGAGCAAGATPREAEASAAAKLARVGLEVVTDEEARVPPADRGRWIACRVIPGFREPPAPEHPAGYLIASVGRQAGMTRRDMERAIAAWKEGERLILTIRRNPYFPGEPDWYEVNVPVILPRTPEP